MFGCIFGDPVGNPGGNILTDPRNRADPDTDQGGANNFGDVFYNRAELGQYSLKLLGLSHLKPVFENLYNLGNPEGTN